MMAENKFSIGITSIKLLGKYLIDLADGKYIVTFRLITNVLLKQSKIKNVIHNKKKLPKLK